MKLNRYQLVKIYSLTCSEIGKIYFVWELFLEIGDFLGQLKIMAVYIYITLY